MTAEDDNRAKKLAEEEYRATERMLKRAQKEAKKLRGKPDLLERAAVVRQRFAACEDRVRRLIKKYEQGKATAYEIKKAEHDLTNANEQGLAIYMAMNDDEKKQWEAAGRRFYKARSMVEKGPTVHDLRRKKSD